jgi:translation initiation factor 4G
MNFINETDRYNIDFIISLKDIFHECPFSKQIKVNKSIKNNNRLSRWGRNEPILFSEPLIKGENAWTPFKSEDENKIILKTVVGILNKLSKDNFTLLSEKMFAIDINNQPLAKSVIEHIFQKAINEPHFGEVYSKLCKSLSKKNYCNDNDETINFKREILTQCQKEFEKEVSNSSDPIVIMTLKKKSLGNIKFVGELFKKDMISDTIMFQCINKLLANINNTKGREKEENIECICKLISTVGEELDVMKYKTNFTYCINQMTIVSKDKSNDFRSRFLIIDVLDLRKNKWNNIKNKGQICKTK